MSEEAVNEIFLTGLFILIYPFYVIFCFFDCDSWEDFKESITNKDEVAEE